MTEGDEILSPQFELFALLIEVVRRRRTRARRQDRADRTEAWTRA